MGQILGALLPLIMMVLGAIFGGGGMPAATGPAPQPLGMPQAAAATGPTAPTAPARPSTAAPAATQPITGNQQASLTPAAPAAPNGQSGVTDPGGGQVLAQGQASMYGPGDAGGNVTASGEAVNPGDYTAAMKDPVPLQSIVKCTNTATGQAVIVRINDRGPFVQGRVIDLTQAGMSAIGGSGLVDVRVEMMPPGTPTGPVTGGGPAVAATGQPPTLG